ncbi:MAG: hypothetical protein HQK84_09295, partial [Nitrospinae bacterium]|nr:hypothetical protein [Nitrospinota bacterium]
MKEKDLKETHYTTFYKELIKCIKEEGDMFNAHLHLDRAGTFNDIYFEEIGYKVLHNSHISLCAKHNLINVIHNSLAYKEEDLYKRISYYLNEMEACGTKRADTMVDVTADNVGLHALQIMKKIKLERTGKIDLRIGAYSPFGFKDSDPKRWEIFEEGVSQADFIGSLPEADDIDDYPEHIGFKEHCIRILELAQKHNCMVHVHTDQRNEPSESGTEQLIHIVQENGFFGKAGEEPKIWAVHMISPSTYDELRFQKLVNGLLECNIGVICCPSAAIGMRQLRPVNTPTYNSIPRILELIAAGVHVRLGSDNISDICSPSTTANLIDEVYILSCALRFYHITILAALAA